MPELAEKYPESTEQNIKKKKKKLKKKPEEGDGSATQGSTKVVDSPPEAETQVGGSEKPKRSVKSGKRRPKNSATSKEKRKSETRDEDKDIAEPSPETDVVDGEADRPLIENTKMEVKRKKKKKRREKQLEGHVNEGLEQAIERTTEPAVREIERSNRVCGVVLHRTDKLRENFLIRHPVVRVHIVDADTGQHLRKLDSERAVSSYYETMKRDKIPDKILPILSQPFDFREMRQMIPWWEETIVFNEEFNHLVDEQPRVIMFFELMDFISMNRAASLSKTNAVEGGYYKIAWAFLKLRGANGQLNTNKQVRLQLYEIPTSSRLTADNEAVPVWRYWSKYNRRTYPSSIYVTVKSLEVESEVGAATRSMFPNQPEQGTISLQEMQRAARMNKSKFSDKLEKPEVWSRLPGQLCKVPNTPSLTLPAGSSGAFRVVFSHDGLYLAASCSDKMTHSILIYSIPSGELYTILEGHYNIIYEIVWSETDKYLLSCSSDGSARLWEIRKNEVKKLMSHPTFVYCCSFAPNSTRIVITGCYDQIIRIWSLDGEEAHARCLQELSGHESYVNSLVFGIGDDRLYSGDNSGMIYVWNVHLSTKKSLKNSMTHDWSYNSKISTEVKGQSISKLMMHPSGSRLVIQTKDNLLRSFDLRMLTITQQYKGGLNFRESIHGDITPCGNLLFAGSEDASCYVWQIDTGMQVAQYTDLHYKNSISVAYHPKEHMVAFCSQGDGQKIKVFTYNPDGSKTMMTHGGAEPSTPLEDDQEAQLKTTDRERQEKINRTMTSLLTSSQMLNSQPSSRLNSPRKTDGSNSAAGGFDSLNPWGSTFSTSNLLESMGEKNAGSVPQVVTTLYDYTPQRGDELEFKMNDKISVLNQDDIDWWTGINLRTGKQGLLPSNYVLKK